MLILILYSAQAITLYTQAVMETTGCGTAIVTPFRDDESIDEAALRALVDWQIDSGIDFIVAWIDGRGRHA